MISVFDSNSSSGYLSIDVRMFNIIGSHQSSPRYNFSESIQSRTVGITYLSS
jgi:hypothetical protein